MLKERILQLYGNGDNCAQIILRAAAAEYGLQLSEEVYLACSGIQGGFGVQGMCSALVGAVMVFGLLCEEEVSQKRIIFLLKAQERFSGLDCGCLSAREADCRNLLGEIGSLLQETLEE